jgi:hypothetical protein
MMIWGSVPVNVVSLPGGEANKSGMSDLEGGRHRGKHCAAGWGFLCRAMVKYS